jgi:hypothetical protein
MSHETYLSNGKSETRENKKQQGLYSQVSFVFQERNQEFSECDIG